MIRRGARLILCLLLSGPAYSADTQGVWLDVPFVRQQPDGCGAASLAMVMQYWQRQNKLRFDVDAAEIFRQLHPPQSHGIRASAMEQYLRRHGFRSFVIPGEWTDLEQNLQKGRPLIVALKSGRNDLHYVVVTGLDTRRNLVLTHDPADRQLASQHNSVFEKKWKAAGNWTLLALPE